MAQGHPITPPPELVMQWLEDGPEDGELGISKHIATQAAQWGADTELEACIRWLDTYVPRYCEWSANFRAARRPPTIPAGYPSYEQIQHFMFEAGFDVPDPDQEPALPHAKYMKLAARIVDWTLAQ